jgi:hypothetical protein
VLLPRTALVGDIWPKQQSELGILMKPPIKEDEKAETHPVSAEAEMAKYGITRVPVDYFHYRDYRYTSLEDAIAQARRDDRLV